MHKSTLFHGAYSLTLLTRRVLSKNISPNVNTCHMYLRGDAGVLQLEASDGAEFINIKN